MRLDPDSDLRVKVNVLIRKQVAADSNKMALRGKFVYQFVFEPDSFFHEITIFN